MEAYRAGSSSEVRAAVAVTLVMPSLATVPSCLEDFTLLHSLTVVMTGGRGGHIYAPVAEPKCGS